MKKKILTYLATASAIIILATALAYAMTSTPWCYYSAPGVCTDITAATPLPIYVP